MFELAGRNVPKKRMDKMQAITDILKPNDKRKSEFTYKRIYTTKWYDISDDEDIEEIVEKTVDQRLEKFLRWKRKSFRSLIKNKVTLKAAIFATDEKLTFLDMQLFEDNIYNLLTIAETYILKNIKWKSEIIGTEREEMPEIPVAVIREILANSFHQRFAMRQFLKYCI